MKRLSTEFLDLPDIRIAYTQHGSGPALILLHGNSENKAIFTAYQHGIFADYHTYALDSRGHGQSRSKDDALSIKQFSRDVIAFCQSKGITQATGEEAEMIGLSWKDSSFKMTLVQPNGTALPASGDGVNVIHVSGTTYDYYFLKQPAKGSWYVDIAPINPASTGAAYSLISGQVKGTLPENQV
jgi:hypothetical protein